MLRKAPCIPILGALIAGIITGSETTWPEWPFTICACIAAASLFISIILHRYTIASVCIALIFFCIGFLHINLYLDPLSSKKDIFRCNIPTHEVIVEGVVAEPPRVTPYKTDLIVDICRIIQRGQSRSVDEKVLISIYGWSRVFKYGNYIRARVKLKKPQNFGNPGAFDYERHLLFQGIRMRGSISNPADIIVLREYLGNSFRTSLEEYRSQLRHHIALSTSGDEKYVLIALILGDTAGISDDILDDFSRTGLTHIIAISGLNIGIVAFLSIFLVRTIMNTSEYLLLRFNRIRVSTCFALVPIIIYTFVAGCGIATIRATLMIGFFLAALLTGRDRSPCNTLSLAALAVLMFSPSSLFDISFQLSFIAVASLIFALPPLNHLIELLMHHPRYERAYFLKYILLSLSINLAATLGTLPVVTYYFNRISTISLLANFFLVPLLGFIVIPLGIIFIIFNPFSSVVSSLILNISSFVTGISLALTHAFSSLPFSSVRMFTPTVFEIILFYVFAGSIIVIITSNRNKHTSLVAGFVALAAFVCLTVSTLSTLRSHNNDMALEVTFLDVGQGSSTFVRIPGGQHTMLLDGGGFYDRNFDTGRFIVAPFLWHEGIVHIDTVVLSHPDEDHSGGLPFILENFDVGEVWTNRDVSDSDTFKGLMNIIMKRHIRHRYICSDGHDITLDGVVLTVLNPPCAHRTGLNDITAGINSDSAVIKITYRGQSILITSDIDEPAEAWLLGQGRNLRSLVMSAPHHGARTSNSAPFIARADPEIAIFSCGVNNVFGFPSPDVLTRYESHGAHIFRTDRDGAIRVSLNGESIVVRTWKTDKVEYFGISP